MLLSAHAERVSFSRVQDCLMNDQKSPIHTIYKYMWMGVAKVWHKNLEEDNLQYLVYKKIIISNGNVLTWSWQLNHLQPHITSVNIASELSFVYILTSVCKTVLKMCSIFNPCWSTNKVFASVFPSPPPTWKSNTGSCQRYSNHKRTWRLQKLQKLAEDSNLLFRFKYKIF